MFRIQISIIRQSFTTKPYMYIEYVVPLKSSWIVLEFAQLFSFVFVNRSIGAWFYLVVSIKVPSLFLAMELRAISNKRPSCKHIFASECAHLYHCLHFIQNCFQIVFNFFLFVENRESSNWKKILMPPTNNKKKLKFFQWFCGYWNTSTFRQGESILMKFPIVWPS